MPFIGANGKKIKLKPIVMSPKEIEDSKKDKYRVGFSVSRRVECKVDHLRWYGTRDSAWVGRTVSEEYGFHPPYRKYWIKGKKQPHRIIVETLNQMENLIASPAR